MAKNEANGGSHKPNTRRKISELINQYVLDPTIFRNKIAHGQWSVALNNTETCINPETTARLAALDVIDVYKSKVAFTSLAKIVEDLVESPNKAHPRDYWQHVAQLESEQAKMSSWTLEHKTASLKMKKLNKSKNR